MSSILVGLTLQIENLTAHEKLILISLADNANREGHCFPNLTTIAKNACCSRRTAQRSLKHLENAGWISVLETFRDGRQTSNTYHLNLEKLGGVTVAPRGCQSDTGGGVRVTPSRGCQSDTPVTVKKEQKAKSPIDPNEFAEYRRTAPPQMTYHVWIKRKKAKIPMRDPL